MSSLSNYEGIVTLKSGKEFHGRMLWSFQIKDSRRYWRCGQVEPEVEEGEWISFSSDNQGNVDPNSILTSLDVSAAGTASTEPASTASATPPSDVGARVRYQAARRDAAAIVVAALHTDHLPHAANVAKNKRLQLLEGYVEEVTKKLLEQEERNI